MTLYSEHNGGDNNNLNYLALLSCTPQLITFLHKARPNYFSDFSIKIVTRQAGITKIKI